MKAGVPAVNTSALQFIYNPIQVIICSYMFMEAAIQAYRNVSLREGERESERIEPSN
jgi:hypothetical protein